MSHSRHDKRVISFRLKHLITSLVIGSAVCSVACNRSGFWWLGPGRNIERVLAVQLPDRMVVIGRSSQGRKPLRDITDRATIDGTIAFFKRYPDGWAEFSGAFGDYEFQFSRNGQPLIRMGIKDASVWSPGEARLNVGNYRRQVPEADVAALVSRLSLAWPPPR
jgi:hypothetical protein